MTPDGRSIRVGAAGWNHYRGKAVVNAVQCDSLLTGRAAPAPLQLVRAYPAALGGIARAA